MSTRSSSRKSSHKPELSTESSDTIRSIDRTRVQSGIEGLDTLIEGGFLPSTLNLLAGKAGTGRTAFSMQFLYHGAKKLNEPGVYVTLEKEPPEIVENMESFGWDLKDLMAKNKLSIIKPDLHRFDSLKQLIEDELDRINAKRLVINPFSFITAYFNNVYDIRKSLSDFRRQMKKLNCTAILVTDIPEDGKTYSSTGFEEFVVSSVIALDLVLKKDSNSFVRTAFIRKMERTNHSLKLVPMEITKEGVSIYPDAEVF